MGFAVCGVPVGGVLPIPGTVVPFIVMIPASAVLPFGPAFTSVAVLVVTVLVLAALVRVVLIRVILVLAVLALITWTLAFVPRALMLPGLPAILVLILILIPVLVLQLPAVPVFGVPGVFLLRRGTCLLQSIVPANGGTGEKAANQQSGPGKGTGGPDHDPLGLATQSHGCLHLHQVVC